MGNCIPSHQIVQGSDDECDKKTDDTLIVSSSNNGTTPSPAAALEQCPTKPKKRKGMEGLLDCGFEYRFLKCPRHANDDADDDHLPISCRSTIIVCLQCSTRLFHVDSGTMITANNRKDYIADGAQFDEVANLCQEITQERLQQCFHLKFVTVNNGDITNNNNKENEGIIINNNNQQEQPQPIKIQALVDQDYYHHDDAEKKAETPKNQDDDLHHHHQQLQRQQGLDDDNDNFGTEGPTPVTNGKSKQQNNNNKMKKTRPILVIIAGKGKSRAGILSVKHLLISGMEQGSAICHLVEAKRRGYGVMLLDPNTPDASNGMEVIEQSFQFFFGNNNTTANNAKTPPPPPQLYILAHSASGGFVARLLFEERQRRNGRSSNNICWLEYIQSLVFTDSTHNIQWYLRDDPTLCDFLQSPKCLYIRNTSEHPSDTFANHKHKQAGELMSALEQTIWWRRRFGTIRTVWAGTSDHSLMCWVAREVIWIFFDACSR